MIPVFIIVGLLMLMVVGLSPRVGMVSARITALGESAPSAFSPSLAVAYLAAGAGVLVAWGSVRISILAVINSGQCLV